MSLERKIWDEQMQGKQSIGKENCPLCLDKEYIIKSFNFWKIFKNKYPYAGIEKHILLVPNRHIEHTKALNNDELLEIPEIEAYIEDFFEEENYFSFIRQTNEGKSIKHVHYHYLPGVLYSTSMETILTKDNHIKKGET